MTTPWYLVENVDEVYSPALLVYPDRVQANLQRMIEYAGGTARLRPHVKTHKMAEVIEMQVAAGIDKFKVATFAEAEMVASAGGPDILLAYPLVGPNVGRFVQLIKMYSGARFSCVADERSAIEALSRELSKAGLSAEVLLELDDGMHRTGIEPGEEAARLYRLIAQLPGVEPGGFHVYDGQVRDKDLEQRVKNVEAAFVPVAVLKQRLESEGLPVPRVVCGGTPTFPAHCRHPDRELSPGTCVFWDIGYGTKFPDLEFEPAAAVLTRVISKPAENRLCLDLGYKAIASDNPDPRVRLLDLPDAKMVVHSEEHLVVETPEAGKYHVADALYGVPWHICPTCALYQQAVVIRDGRAVDRWRVAARDRVLQV